MAKNTLTTFPGVAKRDGEIEIPRIDYKRHTVSFIDEGRTKAERYYPTVRQIAMQARENRVPRAYAE